MIGTARENPARVQLAKLLPEFVSAGSGIVIDSFGGQSKQQDIVLFERDFCPVYSINDTPEATHFPIEGVIAVGEVKSVVDKPTLFDALDKIRSAKSLRRFSERTQSPLGAFANFRTYGVGPSFAATRSDEYNQEQNYRDQLFGFIICKSLRSRSNAVLENLREYCLAHTPAHMPNFIVALDDGFFQGANLPSRSLHLSPLTANAFAFVPDRRCFTFLVHTLQQHVRDGRTVPLSAFNRYMSSITGQLPDTQFLQFR